MADGTGEEKRMKLRNCDMKSFSERCRKKKIVCYGIGNEFHRMIKGYSGYEWADRIHLLADRNKGREGEAVQIKGREYFLVSLDTLIKELTEDMVLLVTCMAYADVVKELNRISALDEVECYLFHFMFSLSEGEEIQIRRSEEPLIPPVIHYCWFGGGDKPDLYKRCIENWHKYCPDYQVREWNEDSCDINETVYTKQAYGLGKYGFVPDYFRLKIIYEHGGIYLDTDVEMLKSIDDLRYNKAFCGLEFPGEAAFGLGFGAVKGFPLLLKMMERYRTMPFIREDGLPDETASPVFQTADLIENGMTYENKIQEAGGMTIYPVEVLSPQNVYTGTVSISPNTLMCHHFDGSWLDGDRLDRKRNRRRESAAIQRMIDVGEGERYS